jgi:hypothetical protein
MLCQPTDKELAFQVSAHGAAPSQPTSRLSTNHFACVTATLSEADAVSVTVPDSTALPVGQVTATLGAWVSAARTPIGATVTRSAAALPTAMARRAQERARRGTENQDKVAPLCRRAGHTANRPVPSGQREAARDRGYGGRQHGEVTSRALGHSKGRLGRNVRGRGLATNAPDPVNRGRSGGGRRAAGTGAGSLVVAPLGDVASDERQYLTQWQSRHFTTAPRNACRRGRLPHGVEPARRGHLDHRGRDVRQPAETVSTGLD